MEWLPPPPFEVHDEPDEVVREKIKQLKSLKREPGEVTLPSGHKLTKYQYQLRLWCQSDWWFLARAPLGMHWLDEDLHGRTLLRHYFRPTEEGGLTDEFDKATLIPRGHVKTLFLGCSRTINKILRNPAIQVMYASATIPLAQDVGLYVSDALIFNPHLQEAFPDILPRSKQQCAQWGVRGYRLPAVNTKDPTFFSASLDTNVTGKHPDVLFLDDLIVEQTNTPGGWEKGHKFIKNGLSLLPPHGYFEWLATRWHDSDVSSMIINDEVRGKQGKVSVLIMSCWVDDDERKGPIWPAKKRWGADTVSGYTTQQLLDMKHTQGAFFNAQMRNDPKPEDEQVLNMADINTYKEGEFPAYDECRTVGIEVTGGGVLIYNTLLERVQTFALEMPLVEITNEKAGRSGLTKEDMILAEIEPVIREGRLYLREDMLEDYKRNADCLGHEIYRLGAARHDDIVDALHALLKYLAAGVRPEPTEPCHMYIACDLAFTDKARSDYSVLLAAVIDHKGNVWVIDYDRFKLASPVGISDRIIQFYRKWQNGKASNSGHAGDFGRRPTRHSFSKAYK